MLSCPPGYVVNPKTKRCLFVHGKAFRKMSAKSRSRMLKQTKAASKRKSSVKRVASKRKSSVKKATSRLKRASNAKGRATSRKIYKFPSSAYDTMAREDLMSYYGINVNSPLTARQAKQVRQYLEEADEDMIF